MTDTLTPLLNQPTAYNLFNPGDAIQGGQVSQDILAPGISTAKDSDHKAALDIAIISAAPNRPPESAGNLLTFPGESAKVKAESQAYLTAGENFFDKSPKVLPGLFYRETSNARSPFFGTKPPTETPEPSTVATMGIATFGFLIRRRKTARVRNS